MNSIDRLLMGRESLCCVIYFSLVAVAALGGIILPNAMAGIGAEFKKTVEMFVMASFGGVAVSAVGISFLHPDPWRLQSHQLRAFSIFAAAGFCSGACLSVLHLMPVLRAVMV
ncbi:MAG: hypothetical protein U1A28_01085 [Patescibacteria group bacterium]|nr:hypothetical protein [Patescibacteria group bacterium]